MTAEQAREKLQSVRLLELYIEQLRTEKEMILRDTGLHSVDFKEERARGRPRERAPFENLILKAELLDDEINRHIAELLEERNAIIKRIQQIKKPLLVDVLFRVYVEGKRSEKVAAEMFYEAGYVRKLVFLGVRAFAAAADPEEEGL